MKKKLTVFVALLTLGTTLLTGCGGGGDSKADSKAETYTAHYDSTSYADLSVKSFFPKVGEMSCVDMMAQSDQSFADYTLKVSADAYTLTADYYTADPENGERYKVGDDSGIAITVKMVATGKVTESSDGSITIGTADSVTYSIPEDTCDTICKEQMAPMFSFSAVDAETACGEWTSDDVPELLDAVPESTFTVSDGAIDSWK